MRTSALPPRVGLRFGDRTFPAIPVALDGDRASLFFFDVPPAHGDVHLVLDWESGAVTELAARVRNVEDDLSVVDLDVCEVTGAWEPFLDYLGASAA